MASDTGDALKTCWTCAHSGYPIPRGDYCDTWADDESIHLWWDSIEPDVDDDSNMPARDCGPCPGWGERNDGEMGR